MAHFYGTLENTIRRGATRSTRCGHKSERLATTVKGWSGGVSTQIYQRHSDERDWIWICVHNWDHTKMFTIYDGPVDDLVQYDDLHDVLRVIAEPLIKKTLVGGNHE